MTPEVTRNKPLTERQAEVLDLINSGKTPKEIAAQLGITDTGVYATRRRLADAGHLPKTRRSSGRKQRGLSSRGAATVRRAANGSGDGPPAKLASVIGTGVAIDPVAVISRRVEIVNDEINTHTGRIEESTAALMDLTDESKRLTKALKALTPSPNGRQTNTSARKRRRTPA